VLKSFLTAQAIVLGLVLGGCAVMYPTPPIDPKTGRYPDGRALPPSAILRFDPDIDLSAVRFVYLVADTNDLPARYEFYCRQALARLGFRNVLTSRELGDLIQDTPALRGLASMSDPVSMRRLASAVGPVIKVEFEHTYNGSGPRSGSIRVADAGTGRVMFHVSVSRAIWGSLESDLFYPTLNALGDWVRATTDRAKGAT